jgi:hypothetical protein
MQQTITMGNPRRKRNRESISDLSLANDSVHRVAAGGSSKNRKPAGRNSGATPCYLDVFFPIAGIEFIGKQSLLRFRFAERPEPDLFREHCQDRLSRANERLPASADEHFSERVRFRRPCHAWPRVTFACQREVSGISRRRTFRKSAIQTPPTRMAEGDFRVPKGGCRHQPKSDFSKECDPVPHDTHGRG